MDFDVQEYQDLLRQAAKENNVIEKDMDDIMKNGLDNIFFVGCGGSLAIATPPLYILQRHSKLPSFRLNAGEFNTLKPKALSKNSLVILISSSGTTPETLDAAKLARSLGCTTIGISTRIKPALAEQVDYAYYQLAKDAGFNEFKLMILYQIIFYLLYKLDGISDYNDLIPALQLLPDHLIDVYQQTESLSSEFADRYKNEKIIYTLGAGICWGQTYSFAVCKLEEMQWISSQPIHAGEYFHGPFEITDQKSALLIFKGEDPSKALIDRVIAFSKKYNQNMLIVDTQNFSLTDLPNRLRGYFSPFVLTVILDNFAAKIAEVRNHPLSTRRYMGKVDY
jgi:fructoselysine-6-P-deglycase FrlB-like protein